MDDLRQKVAVVTGAASGIGLAMATRFGGEGMRVVLADVEEGPLKDAAGALTADGVEVLLVVVDVRDADDVESLAAATVDHFGAAHVVCNNAGVYVGGSAWQISAERWRWILDVNVLGVANGVRAFVPRMIDQGEGHVVNTASAAGLITGPGMAPYFASKHAVVALSEGLHQELAMAGHPIGVSVLCPEFVRSNLIDGDRNAPADAAGEGDTDLMGRMMREYMTSSVATGIDPAEVAGRVVEGIRANRLHILTHPTTLDTVKARWAAVEASATA